MSGNSVEFPSTSSGPLCRVHLPKKESEIEGQDGPLMVEELDTARWMELWRDQNAYVDQLEARFQTDANLIKDLEQKVKMSSQDATKREHFLMMRLASKEQELQELANQVTELKASQAPSSASLRNALLDPAVNLVIQRLKRELDSTRTKMQEAQDELSAWKFTPDSVTGKRLMSKCRQLIQENQDIGKMIHSGRLSQLENELAIQKNLAEELKKNQLEMDDFMQELDEDEEGMQSTILLLQQQLKEARDKINNLETELKDAKTNVVVKTIATNEVQKTEAESAAPKVVEEPPKPVVSDEQQPPEVKMEFEQTEPEPEQQQQQQQDEQQQPEKEAPAAEEAKPEAVPEAKLEEAENASETPKEENVEEKAAETNETTPEVKEEAEEEVSPSPTKTGRGRRKAATAAAAATQETTAATTTKRGRPTRGQKREATAAAEEPQTEEQQPSTPAKGKGGRPKRRRNAPQRFEEDEGGKQGGGDTGDEAEGIE